MPASNYPNGFPQGLTVRGVPVVISNPGKVFWVSNASTLLQGDSGGSDGNPGTFQRPFGTLDYAVGQCTANRGDVIFIKPGHAEAISTATALALDVAGIAIFGLGSGANRPTFTLDTATTATIGVTAANISVSNCIFTANFADIVAVFTLGAAKNFSLEGCYIKATATNMNFGYVIDTNATSNDADGLTLLGNVWIEPDTGFATPAFIKMDGTNARLEARNNYVDLKINPGGAFMTIATTKVVTNARIEGNRLISVTGDINVGVFIVTDVSTNSGSVASNYAQHTDTAGEVFVTASSGFSFFENRASGVAGATGYVLPAVDS